MACSGGFRYRPTTSVSFSTKCLSRERLNVSWRCGWILCAFQMRWIVILDNPNRFASMRLLQCVAAGGFSWRVTSMTCRTAAEDSFGFLPGLDLSLSASMPPAVKRFRQRMTVCRFTASSFAMALLDVPREAKSTMVDRSAIFCGVLRPLASLRRATLWMFVIANGEEGVHMSGQYPQNIILYSYLWGTTLVFNFLTTCIA